MIFGPFVQANRSRQANFIPEQRRSNMGQREWWWASLSEKPDRAFTAGRKKTEWALCRRICGNATLVKSHLDMHACFPRGCFYLQAMSRLLPHVTRLQPCRTGQGVDEESFVGRSPLVPRRIYAFDFPVDAYPLSRKHEEPITANRSPAVVSVERSALSDGLEWKAIEAVKVCALQHVSIPCDLLRRPLSCLHTEVHHDIHLSSGAR